MKNTTIKEEDVSLPGKLFGIRPAGHQLGWYNTLAKRHGGTCIGKGANNKLMWECKEGHRFVAPLKLVETGWWKCPDCK